MQSIVFSLGGSAVVPEEIDIEFLKLLKEFLEDLGQKIPKIGIVVGGGRTSRIYQDAARSLGSCDDTDLDIIGIRATLLNAELVRSILGESAYEQVVTDPTKDIKTTRKFIVASGWKPGFSTDFVAVKLACALEAKLLLNVTNVDYVYDSNPNDNPDAKPIEKLTWSQYISRFGTEWKPGLHTPFDPVAAGKAATTGVSVAVLKGDDLENIKKCIQGDGFKGTLIKKG